MELTITEGIKPVVMQWFHQQPMESLQKDSLA